MQTFMAANLTRMTQAMAD